MQHNRDPHDLYCPFASFGSITGNFMTNWTSILYWRKAVPHAWRGSAVAGNNSWHFIHICATKGLASYTPPPLPWLTCTCTCKSPQRSVVTMYFWKKNRNKLFNNTKVRVTFIIYIYIYIYIYIVMYRPIARQRLGKHSRASVSAQQ
jgi:hypothetical protein